MGGWEWHQVWCNNILLTIIISSTLIVLHFTLKNRLSNNIFLRGKKDNCLPAPYIYATTHDQVPNILKYSRNGCLLSQSILNDAPSSSAESDPDHLKEYRSMALGKYKGNDVLYIADAMSTDSQVIIYSDCKEDGTRDYVTTVVNTDINPGVDHVYGLTFDGAGNVYISNQHTDNVMRFARDKFDPMPLPMALQRDPNWKSFFPGTFLQYGKPAVENEQGVRSILVVNDTLWVANEDIDGIAIVKIATGVTTNIVVLPEPIGLYQDPGTGLVFAGSKQKHWRGAVYAILPNELRIVATYTMERMSHPSGITSYGGILYVAEIELGEIFMFNIATQEYLGKMVGNTPGEIEQLIISPC